MPEPKPDGDLSNLAIAGIVGLFVVLAVAANFIFPIFEGPDECWHFEYARLLANGQLPNQLEPSRYVPTQGYNPPAGYVVPSLILALRGDGAEIPRLPPSLWVNDKEELLRRGRTSIPPINADSQLLGVGTDPNLFEHPADGPLASGVYRTIHLLRLWSVFCGAATVLATAWLARAVLPNQPALQAIATLFVACNPKFIHLSGVLTNDPMVAMLGTIAIWQLGRWINATPSVGQVAAMGLLIGIGLLTKTNLLFVLPIAVVILFARTATWRQFFGRSILLLATATVCFGWFPLRNAALYGDMDFFGWKLRMRQEPQFVLPAGERWSYNLREFVPMTLQTFWDRFAWGEVRLPTWQLLLYCAMSVLPVFAIRPLLVRARSPERVPIDPMYALLWSALSLNLAGVLSFSLTFSGSAQGRYLYPTIGVFGVLAARGFQTMIENQSIRVQCIARMVLGGLLILLAILFEFATVAPLYFPPS